MEDVTIEKELPATESSIATVPDMKFAVKKIGKLDMRSIRATCLQVLV